MTKSFEKKSLLKRHKMTNLELADYYKKMRKDMYEKDIEIKNLKLRKNAHPALLQLLKIKRVIADRLELEVFEDKREKTDRPIIFAVNHMGKSDIEMASEAIKDHFYILFADPEQLYRTVEHYFLLANGVIYFDVFDPEDKQVAKSICIQLLNKNQNVMWYPEGTWNLTPSIPVLNMHYGIVEVALRTNAIIIPVAVEQKEKRFYVNIGENFDVDSYKESYNDEKELKIEAIQDLRDAMATLRWNIWESFPKEKRENISDDYYENYLKMRQEEWPAFEADNINSRIYKMFRGQRTVDEEDVFSFVDKLDLNKNNAFILRK